MKDSLEIVRAHVQRNVLDPCGGALLSDGADNFERNLTEEFTVITQDVGPRPGVVQLMLRENEPDFDAEAEMAVNELLLDRAAETGGGGVGQQPAAAAAGGMKALAVVSQEKNTLKAANAAKAAFAKNARSNTAKKALALVEDEYEENSETRLRVAKEALREEWLREASWHPLCVEIVNATHGVRSAFSNDAGDSGGGGGEGGGCGGGDSGGAWLRPNAPRPSTLSPVSAESDLTAYRVTVLTANFPGSGTDAGVTIRLCGYPGGDVAPPVWSAPAILDDSNDNFEPGSIDEFILKGMPNLGPITNIEIGIDRRIAGDGGLGHEDLAAWHLQFVEVVALGTGETSSFPVDARLTADIKPRVKVSAAAGGAGTGSGSGSGGAGGVERRLRHEALAAASRDDNVQHGALAAAEAAAASAAAWEAEEAAAAAAALYRVTVKTAEGDDAGTDGHVFGKGRLLTPVFGPLVHSLVHTLVHRSIHWSIHPRPHSHEPP